MKKYIITGAPSSGKSAIIELLEEQGYTVLSETSKLIIDKLGLMPWDDQELFCETFRRVQIRREEILSGDLVFLDRALPDPIAYAEVDGCRINVSFYADIKRAGYERTAFFFEMLPAFKNDQHRADTIEQALAVDRKLREVYSRLGFTVIFVPVFSDDMEESKRQRMEFIINHVSP